MTTINKLDLDDIMYFSVNKSIDTYQDVASGSAIYPGQGTPLGLSYCALKLNGEAGELAEHVGKAMRDDDLISIVDERGRETVVQFEPLTEERRNLIIKELGDVLWYISAIARELDMKLSDVAWNNLMKLRDRQERDALRGSGDER